MKTMLSKAKHLKPLSTTPPTLDARVKTYQARTAPKTKRHFTDHILNGHNEAEYINTVAGFHMLDFLPKRNDESKTLRHQARTAPKTHTSEINNDNATDMY